MNQRDELAESPSASESLLERPKEFTNEKSPDSLKHRRNESNFVWHNKQGHEWRKMSDFRD